MSGQGELPFEGEDSNGLPRGWVVAPLGDVASIQSGVTKNSKKGKLTRREVPYLRVANVQRGWLDLTEVKTIWATEDKIAQTRLQPGDVLFNEGGDRDKLGRGWVWSGEIEECVHQNHVFRARPRTGVLSKYLSYFGNSWGRDYFLNAGKQTTNLASINQRMLRALPVRLAPLPEQHRIVAEIEKHFTRLDAAVATLEAVQVKLKRARASVLKAAVEGRLVPTEADLARAEGRDYEPASVLLERILEERRARWDEAQAGAKRKKKYKEPVEPETEGLGELPEGWVWVTIEQTSSALPRSIQSGPFGSSLKHSEFQSEGKLVIGIDNVQDGYFSPGRLNRISEGKFAELIRFQARPKDLAITVMATIGRCCVVPASIEPAIITKHVYRITLEPQLAVPEYLMASIRSPFGREKLLMESKGQTRPGLNGTIIKAQTVPLPPPREQTRIVSEVERRLSVIDALDQTVQVNLARCTRLRQSILKRAFEGKLVPQDPNDEPASVLLERIKQASP